MIDKTWGARLNERQDYQHVTKKQKPRGCPDWLNSHQVSTWQEEGLIIWNDTDKTIEKLHVHEALRLLNQLTSRDNWKSEGVSITRLVYEGNTQTPTPSLRKKTEQEPEVETSKSDPLAWEIMRLPPEAGPELIELLQTNHHVLSEMAEREKKRADEAMSQVWDFLLELSHKAEQKEIDFESRSFEWRSDSPSRWTCEYKSTEGRVWLGKSKLFWHACVKRQGYAGNSHRCMKLLEAVEWVEKEVIELANQPEAEELPGFRSRRQKEADRARLRQKLVDGPYWIDPSVMEPKQVTYQVFMELDAKPIDFKTYESTCGETYEYDKRFPSPSKMATVLNLDFDRYNIDQPVGESSEWFRIVSRTTYYQETSVAEQAQKAWDQSKILQQFREGKITRARYGYLEIETGYAVFLGACEDPDKPWKRPPTRKDCMEMQAVQESLSFALDVSDYRDYLGLSAELISDEQILEMMHETRTRSRYLPEEIRRSSRIWLAEHEPLK